MIEDIDVPALASHNKSFYASGLRANRKTIDMGFNRGQFNDAIRNGVIEWQRHALERMMERGISRESVKSVLLNGEIIEDYSHDGPFPSALFFGLIQGEPVHAVAAFDSESGCCFVITAYRPDLDHFESDYRTRRCYDS